MRIRSPRITPLTANLVALFALALACVGTAAVLVADARGVFPVEASDDEGTAYKKNVKLVTDEKTLKGGGVAVITAQCSPGHRVIGGGYRAENSFVTVPGSIPSIDRTAWIVTAFSYRKIDDPTKVVAWAYCAPRHQPVVP